MNAIGILLICIGAAFWRFLGASPVDRFFGNFNAYDRAAHPGNAVRVQVHFDPMWAWKFWIGYWEAFKK